jgi:TPP-dependent indolepyruvate ferredoxin oxidoreductase alpha subunit
MRTLEREPAYRDIYQQILSCGPGLIYTAGLPVMMEEAPPGVHVESCVNEKAAYEMALAGAIAHKRTACLLSVDGVYETLDPLMSSAYTGVKGGFVVVCMKEGALDVTPLGPFSKLPVLVSDGTVDDLASTLSFAFDLSERHEMPCLVETLPPKGHLSRAAWKAPEGSSNFVKNQDRWAAIPRFRYQLHKALNEKIARISEEFEAYRGNVQALKGPRGVITHRACTSGLPKDASHLILGSVFPLPARLVSSFIQGREEVQIVEGDYPAIEVQVRKKERVDGRLSRIDAEACSTAVPEGREELFGFVVVRDKLGPASALNMAHGMARGGTRKILAVTDIDAFLHSGLPAFVNTLYNGSEYLLVIKTKGRSEVLARVLLGFGFERFFELASVGDLQRYENESQLTVLSYEGEL